MQIYQTLSQTRTAACFFGSSYKVYTINRSGQKVEIPELVIKCVRSPLVHQEPGFKVGGIDYFGAFHRTEGKQVHLPDWSSLCERGRQMDRLLTNLSISSYRQVLLNTDWLNIYKPNVTQTQKWNWELSQVETVSSADLFACRKCGIILDKRQIEIDHQRSKTFGKIDEIPEAGLWGATLKLFRYANLTIAGPQGFKAKRLTLSRTGGDAFDKFQLNDDGIVVLSLLLGVKQDNDLQRAAETSIPNLRPLCGGCNKAEGEPHHGLPWYK